MAEAHPTRRRPARFLARLLMLLALSFAATARPALAQQILRDAETEALLRDMSRPLIEAAGLQPENVRIVIIGDPLDQRLHRRRPDRLPQFRPVHPGRERQRGPGRDRPRARPYRRRPRPAPAAGRPAGDRDHDPVAAARRRGDRRRRAARPAWPRSWPASRRRWAASSPSPATRRTAPTRPAPPSSPAPGSAAAARIAFFRRLRESRIPDDRRRTRTTATPRPTRSAASASPRLEERYQADPAWDRRTDPALEERFQRVRAKLSGYVDDARQVLRPLSAEQPIRSRPIMPAPMPITAPAHPDEANAEVGRPARRRGRTIPISSS